MMAEAPPVQDRRWVSRRFAALAAVILILLLAPTHFAQARRYTAPHFSAIVIDAQNGTVLSEQNADQPTYPASLTKMMTLYLLFDALRAGKLTMASEIPVSANAAAQPAVHLGLKAGETIPVETTIKAIVVCSDNDVAVAVGEALGGTEAQFATMMNAEAHTLGMTHTFYRNASGLPDDLQVTTAGDLAVLARHLVYDFPEYFPYFRTPSMSWQGRDYNTHDMLIGNYRGADGIKTGYIDASGYNLVTTVLRGNTRLIAVVMGGISRERRDEAMVNLLDDAFAQVTVATQ
jgi:D-alanyl-D-alanine carboxypeptidase